MSTLELKVIRQGEPYHRSEKKRISWVKECSALLLFPSALMWLHGADNYHGEQEDMERERVSAAGIKPKKPWELFTDGRLRWQLLTVILLNGFQQLNGINAVSGPNCWFYCAWRIQAISIVVCYAITASALCTLLKSLFWNIVNYEDHSHW